MPQGSAPNIMDGGIRRGINIAKALAVAVGRPVWLALTVGGPGGIAGLMDYFNRELVNTVLPLGVEDRLAWAPLWRSHERMKYGSGSRACHVGF